MKHMSVSTIIPLVTWCQVGTDLFQFLLKCFFSLKTQRLCERLKEK